MIAIVDYRAGNLASVKKAFEHIGQNPVVTSDPEVVAKSEKIVLPGVGHFAATSVLIDSGLREAIAGRIQEKTPFLGICVGMQWMLAGSEEAPGIEGLGIWPDQCVHFPAGVKAPHVGWNQLEIRDTTSRLLKGIDTNSFVYFTHSYRVPLLQTTVAESEYGGKFSAAVEKDHLFGVQFHPEKSGDVGLQMLKNFCSL
ncbi:MAG TPA: imidazole glycerol phosphate synthase subunit HisH [Terriglobales bacterium]|jgi:glutamine amidotransferase